MKNIKKGETIDTCVKHLRQKTYKCKKAFKKHNSRLQKCADHSLTDEKPFSCDQSQERKESKGPFLIQCNTIMYLELNEKQKKR